VQRNFITVFFLTLASAALCAAGVDGTSPVPEPGSIILLGSAAAGLGFAAWRRSRKK
jgi:hypothetical protein